MSLCESTPDVPKNIIADPEVRRTRARASSTIILGIIPFDHPSIRVIIHPSRGCCRMMMMMRANRGRKTDE